MSAWRREPCGQVETWDTRTLPAGGYRHAPFAFMGVSLYLVPDEFAFSVGIYKLRNDSEVRPFFCRNKRTWLAAM